MVTPARTPHPAIVSMSARSAVSTKSFMPSTLPLCLCRAPPRGYHRLGSLHHVVPRLGTVPPSGPRTPAARGAGTPRRARGRSSRRGCGTTPSPAVVPASRSCGRMAGDGAEHLLVGYRHEHRPPEGRDLVDAVQQVEVLGRRLAQADARVDDDPLGGDARGRRAGQGLAGPGAHRGRARPRRGTTAGRTLGGPKKWVSTTPTPPAAATRAISGSRRPVGSLRIAAPAAMAASATGGLKVSIATGVSVRAAQALDDRHHAADLHLHRRVVRRSAATRRPPPPRRRRPAARRRPWATARSVPALTPPSLNESGLALTIPTRRPRAQSIAPAACVHTASAALTPPRAPGAGRSRRSSGRGSPTGAHVEGRTRAVTPGGGQRGLGRGGHLGDALLARPQQHRRARARDGGAQAALAVDQAADGLDARHHGTAVGLVEAVLEQGGQVVEAPLAQGQGEADGARQGGGRVGQRHRLGQRPARLVGAGAHLGDDHDEGQALGQRAPAAPPGPGTTATRPPLRHAAALSEWPSISVARASRSSGVQRRPPRALAAMRPEHTAAADEPRPRPKRDAVLALDRQARRASRGRSPAPGTPGWWRPRAPRRRPRRSPSPRAGRDDGR